MVNSRNKGFSYERELVKLARASRVNSQRAWGSDGRSIGHAAGVDLLVGPYRIQAKRVKKLPVWVEKLIEYIRGDEADAIVFRADKDTSWVLLSYYEYLDLVKAAQDDNRPPGECASVDNGPDPEDQPSTEGE